MAASKSQVTLAGPVSDSHLCSEAKRNSTQPDLLQSKQAQAAPTLTSINFSSVRIETTNQKLAQHAAKPSSSSDKRKKQKDNLLTSSSTQVMNKSHHSNLTEEPQRQSSKAGGGRGLKSGEKGSIARATTLCLLGNIPSKK